MTISKKTKRIPMNNCCEIATKKMGFIYVDEECDNKASYTVTYILNNKLTIKTLCKKHFKLVKTWLERIKITYNCVYHGKN